jgi:AMIN domain-containing protein
MYRFPRTTLVVLAFAASNLPTQGQVGATSHPAAASTASASLSSIRRVQVLGNQTAVEIEIEASEHIAPQAQVLTGPDRLVLDFPNAVPGNQLRSQSVNRGAVKDVRVGLFTSNPPVTRIVLDLNSAQSYQIFPAGRTVIVKLSGGAVDNSAGVDDFPETDPPATRPGLVNTKFPVRPLPLTMSTSQASARPKLEVSFNNGLLAIRSNKASLSEILYAIHQRTGADIAVPAGAEQEQVAADLGPGPAAEVLAHLLNGSRFNFLILNSANDARVLDRVILSPRGEGATSASLVPVVADDSDTAEPTPPTQSPVAAEAAAPVIPPPDVRETAPRNPPDTDPQQNDSPD